jgi:hypothetical protein
MSASKESLAAARSIFQYDPLGVVIEGIPALLAIQPRCEGMAPRTSEVVNMLVEKIAEVIDAEVAKRTPSPATA